MTGGAGRERDLGITILVAAEEASAASPTGRALAGAGFVVETAANGIEALELARRLKPDLVVLETALGRLNGWEVLRALQAQAQAQTPMPVVLLARENDPDTTEGLELGADDCLGRSSDPRELVARVRAVLRRSHAAGARHVTRDIGGDDDGEAVPAGRGAPTRRRMETAAPQTARRTLGTYVTLARAYVQLTKPGVMALLLATTFCAMVMAAAGAPPLGLVCWTLLGGALATGGAGAINHYLDRDIDPRMGGRTASRPIPAGMVAPRHALAFGLALSALSCVALVAFVNPLSAVLAMLGLLGYVFVYTLWLKRSTPSNIVIGGAAGAVPPLVGWAAVTNEVSSPTPWYLFAIVFLWTPPHFWALALLISRHYAAAGIPMLPVVRGEDETRRQILLYALALVALTLVPFSVRLMGIFYLAAALLLGALFVALALRLWRAATAAAARRLFAYSIVYLAALFAAMALDRSVLRQLAF